MRSFVIPSIFTAVDRFSSPVEKMTSKMGAFAATTGRNFHNAGQKAFALGRVAGSVGLAIAVPLGAAAKSAVDFEDKMSDVAKTTGFQGAELEKFGNSLLSMSTKTRSSLDDLAQIAEIGGQLGIAKKDMTGFVDAANKFNVALGKDFAGGVEEAITSVGKMKTLFSDTKGLNVSEGIMRTGSAINQLGAVGAATSSNISDFALRIGALPGALKPTAQNTLALGAYFEELGLNSQIASGGMTDLLLHAGKQIGGFANQMKISGQAAKEMLMNDPSEFAKRFASSFKGMSADEMAQKLADFNIGSQETIKVIGALGSNTERLTKLQKISGEAFKANKSLIKEYDTKNNNTAANLAKLKNNFQAMAIKIGTAVLPIIQSLVDVVSPLIQRVSDWIGRNKELTGTIVKVAAIIGGLALGISAASFAFGIYQKAVVLAQAAQWLFTAAVLANPVGVFLVGVTALAAGIYGLVSALNSSTQAERLNAEVRGLAAEKTRDQRVEAMILFEKLRNTTVGTLEYNEALKKIDAIQPGIIEKYNLQAGALKNINKAEKELIGNIMKRAETEARAELMKEKMKEAMRLKEEGPGWADQLKAGLLSSLSSGASEQLGFSARDFNNEKIKGLMSDSEMLAKTQAREESKAFISPEKRKKDAESETKKQDSKVVLDFRNMPSWVSVGMTGGSSLLVPQLPSTR